jgi:hypothetical protein
MQYICSTMHQCLHFYENWVNSWQTITGSLEKLNKCKKGTHFAPDWYYWFHFSHVMGTTLPVSIIPPDYAKCTPGAVWVPKPEIVNLAPILPQTKNLTCWKVPIGYNTPTPEVSSRSINYFSSYGHKGVLAVKKTAPLEKTRPSSSWKIWSMMDHLS